MEDWWGKGKGRWIKLEEWGKKKFEGWEIKKWEEDMEEIVK